VRVVIDAGARGITVHPRQDERHIRRLDVCEIADELRPLRGRVEFNIEGDPRPDQVELVHAVRPDQCTLVPVLPGEITSQAGWSPETPVDEMTRLVADFRAAGIRVSIFVDPEPRAVRWAARLGADRVELYTEPFARAFDRGPEAAAASFAVYAEAAHVAHEEGLGVNAGHDLNLHNLSLFHSLPHLDEVSIGHALMAHALSVGLRQSVTDYLAAVAGHPLR
jgi:pyridoxine 5-phosphate synthase